MAFVDVVTGRTPRLLVHAPPRHGKSDLISHWGPVWALELYEWFRIINCSYEAGLATLFSRKVRNTIVAYKHRLSARISEDKEAAGEWETHGGGGMKAAGVGGPITGRGCNLLLIDDPYKNWAQANSVIYRDAVWDWWGTTALTRLEPGGGVIVTMTRWHDDDLAGRIMKNEDADQWRVINLPALAEEDDPLGRKEGKALWPDRFDEESLRKVRRRNTYAWLSLYQGHPPSLHGNLIYSQFRDDERPEGNIDSTFELTTDMPLDIAIDFNIDPGMHAIVGQTFADGDDVKITSRYEIHAPGMDVRRMMQAFRDLIERELGGWQWTELRVFGDATGQNRWAGTGKSCWDIVKEECVNAGFEYRMKVGTHNPNPADRANVVNAAMLDLDGNAHYFVHPSCVRLITDYKSLRWDGNEINKKDRKLSHPSDADGYRVYRVRPMRKIQSVIGSVGSLKYKTGRR